MAAPRWPPMLVLMLHDAGFLFREREENRERTGGSSDTCQITTKLCNFAQVALRIQILPV